MEKTGRIINAEIDVDDEQVHNFFDNRVKKKLYHRYNLVNYQDNNPTLALERDKQEKGKITPLLNISGNMRILDIGCGVGRWGDELVPYLVNGIYVGVDYSEHLIQVAQKAAEDNGSAEKRKYCVGSFQNLEKILSDQNVKSPFDLIIINGVLMYINDCDLEQCLGILPELLSETGRIYTKESVGIYDRLTLKDIYSEELSSQYSAIYRSKKEYDNIFGKHFSNMIIISEGDTFDNNNLHNRKETTSYYWIFENNKNL